jgi:hypothetical protein
VTVGDALRPGERVGWAPEQPLHQVGDRGGQLYGESALVVRPDCDRLFALSNPRGKGLAPKAVGTGGRRALVTSGSTRQTATPQSHAPTWSRWRNRRVP